MQGHLNWNTQERRDVGLPLSRVISLVPLKAMQALPEEKGLLRRVAIPTVNSISPRWVRK